MRRIGKPGFLLVSELASRTPTRAAALERLAEFLPHSGRSYASHRNYDVGSVASGGGIEEPVPAIELTSSAPMAPAPRSNVSVLSAYIRHRLITEQEVVEAVLSRHTAAAAEKFIQEVCWRTYWKGWLEMRPHVWRHYLGDLRRQQVAVSEDRELAARFAAATSGQTGIDCFDTWAQELVATGYLHNHTRMWFASIWTYTLDLPWQLGADFFMRHLLDGDPASNTLSWRWVVGLQTAGKTYLARADNIETYTNGRFAPYGVLSLDAPPLDDTFEIGKPLAIAPADPVPAGKLMLLLHEDDLSPESWPVDPRQIVCVAGLRTAAAYPQSSMRVIGFKQAALADAIARAQAHFSAAGRMCPVIVLPADTAETAPSVAGVLTQHATAAGGDAIVTMGCPVGPTADAVRPILAALRGAGWRVAEARRTWDAKLWPHATSGYFKFKEKTASLSGLIRGS